MHPKSETPLFRLAIPFLVLAISGCTFFRLVRSSKLKVPDFAYVRCDLKSVSDRSALLDITVSAKNPNAIGLRNVYVDYELFTEGRRFLHGSQLAVELAPKGMTELHVPAEVVYAEVAAVAGPVAAQVLMDRKTLPVRIDAVVHGKPTVYNEVEEGALFQFSWKVSRTEEVPIPQEQREAVKKRAMKALKKLF
jgi:hypothetical protein